MIDREKLDEKRRIQDEYQKYLIMQRMEKLQQKLNDETMKKHEYDNIV